MTIVKSVLATCLVIPLTGIHGKMFWLVTQHPQSVGLMTHAEMQTLPVLFLNKNNNIVQMCGNLPYCNRLITEREYYLNIRFQQ